MRVAVLAVAAISLIAIPGQGIAAVRGASGGTRGLTVVLTPAAKYKAGKLDLARSVVQSRIDRLPVVDASISSRGSDIVVHLPGVTDTAVAQRLVVGAELRFRPVLISAVPAQRGSAFGDAAATAAIASCDANAVAALSSIPTTSWADDVPDACVVLPDKPGGQNASRYYLGPAALTGKTVGSAKPEFVSSQGWTLNMDFTDSGSTKWDELAQRQFHHQVAITLDSLVQSAPTIQPNDATFTSFNGTAVISGQFTQAEAKDLAKLINDGSLPSLFKVKKVTVT